MANADLTLVEADDTETTVVFLGVGRQAAAASKSLTLATEDKAAVDAITTALSGVATETTLDNVYDAIVGNVTHNQVDAGNPAKIGFRTSTGLSGITLVTSGNRTDALSGTDSVLPMRPHAMLSDIVDGTQSDSTGSSTQVLAASGSGIYTWLSYVSLFNTSDADVIVALKSGTTTMQNLLVPANSGVIFNPQIPQPPSGSNEAWNFDAASATDTIYCNALGFKSKIAPV